MPEFIDIATWFDDSDHYEETCLAEEPSDFEADLAMLPE